MVTLLHASDLHFGEPFAPDAGEALMRFAHELEPDAIILSGDFTQRAKRREYAEARAYLDRLPRVPMVVTPGNHDVPLYRVFERLLQPYRNYREFISPELDSITRLDGVTIVSLDSAAPHRAIVNGRIRDDQVAFATRAFEEAGPGIRLLVAHHHFAPAPDYEPDKPIPRARQLLDRFGRMGVEMILGGHLHRAYIGHSLDVHRGADPEHGIVIVQSGTTTSNRGRARESAKNSFNVIRVSSGGFEVIHHMYFADRGHFEPTSRHRFPRRADRFLKAGATSDEAADALPAGVTPP
jgi:3',5'-cyclic AMP phosphodiesterase CpdA